MIGGEKKGGEERESDSKVGKAGGRGVTKKKYHMVEEGKEERWRK